MRWQFLSELLGRDAHSQRMKALHDIERCHRSLSSILSMSVFDPDFDEERYALQKALDEFHSRLKHAVTFNDWWALVERKIKAQRAARAASNGSSIRPK
jgi:hypothetical protein